MLITIERKEVMRDAALMAARRLRACYARLYMRMVRRKKAMARYMQDYDD